MIYLDSLRSERSMGDSVDEIAQIGSAVFLEEAWHRRDSQLTGGSGDSEDDSSVLPALPTTPSEAERHADHGDQHNVSVEGIDAPTVTPSSPAEVTGQSMSVEATPSPLLRSTSPGPSAGYKCPCCYERKNDLRVLKKCGHVFCAEYVFVLDRSVQCARETNESHRLSGVSRQPCVSALIAPCVGDRRGRTTL
jgi:hypothetical protein